MRIRVNAEVIRDDGVSQWGYFHEEVVILPDPDDAEANALALASRTMHEIEAAKIGIGEQASAEVPKIAEEMKEIREAEQAIQEEMRRSGRLPGL